MLWAGLGRTEQSSSNMGMGASAPLPGPDLFFLFKVTFDLGPEQLGRVLPSLASPPWASTSLSEGRSQSGKRSHPLCQHPNKP